MNAVQAHIVRELAHLAVERLRYRGGAPELRQLLELSGATLTDVELSMIDKLNVHDPNDDLITELREKVEKQQETISDLRDEVDSAKEETNWYRELLKDARE